MHLGEAGDRDLACLARGDLDQVASDQECPGRGDLDQVAGHQECPAKGDLDQVASDQECPAKGDLDQVACDQVAVAPQTAAKCFLVTRGLNRPTPYVHPITALLEHDSQA